MYTYIEKTQSRNSVRSNGSIGRGRSSGERQEGVPVQLRARMEEKTGLSFDSVRVHYNSDRPDAVQALAYTQGEDIYLGRGQEHCLPHELGHVIQQRLGVVRANTVINGFPVNTNTHLEREADEMAVPGTSLQEAAVRTPVIQRCPPRSGSGCTVGNEPIRKSASGDSPVHSAAEVGESGSGSAASEDLSQYIDSNENIGISLVVPIRCFGIQDGATGDMFMLSALLLTNRNAGVCITNYEGRIGNKTLKELFQGNLTLKLFHRMLKHEKGYKLQRGKILDEQKHEHYIVLMKIGSNLRVVYKERDIILAKVWKYLRVVYEGDVIKKGEYSELRVADNKNIRKVYYKNINIEKPKAATKAVKLDYNKNNQEMLRVKWGLPTTKEEWVPPTTEWEKKAKLLEKWITETKGYKNMMTCLGNDTCEVYVLWLRFSGAKGGAHIEHDTSIATLREKIKELTKDNSIIVLAGDRKQELVKDLVKEGNGKVFDFTELWADLEYKKFFDKESSRVDQHTFFDYLNARAAKLQHIGMRSGNLESMALIGHEVEYMQEKNSYGGDRAQILQKPEVIKYNPKELPHPLTFKGKLFRIAMSVMNGNSMVNGYNFENIFWNARLENKTAAIGRVIRENSPDQWQEKLCATEELAPHMTKTVADRIKGFYNDLRESVIAELTNLKNLGKYQTSDAYPVKGQYINVLNPMILRLSEELKSLAENKKKRKEIFSALRTTPNQPELQEDKLNLFKNFLISRKNTQENNQKS